jgi:hypothetical protein
LLNCTVKGKEIISADHEASFEADIEVCEDPMKMEPAMSSWVSKTSLIRGNKLYPHLGKF